MCACRCAEIYLECHTHYWSHAPTKYGSMKFYCAADVCEPKSMDVSSSGVLLMEIVKLTSLNFVLIFLFYFYLYP